MVKPLTSSALKAGEWLAENAYLPPGMHRLLTAAGLSGGLLLGRTAMNAVTARDDATERHLKRTDVNPLLRPLYNLMPYNAYSDHAADRWKSVADNIAPLVFGAVGAYLGSRHFFYGRMPSFKGTGKPFNAGSFQSVAKTEEALAGNAKAFTIDTADMAANLAQSDATNKLAAANFSIGSTAGTHLGGAFFPLSNGMSAVRFQQVARHINFPRFIPGAEALNRLLGNRSNGSLRYRSALTDMAKWAESNTLKGVERDVWAHDDIRHHFAQNLLQIFKKVSPEEEKRISDMIQGVLEKGHAQKTAMQAVGITEKEISAELKKLFDGEFLGVGLERNLLNHGFKDQLAQASIGDSGPFRLFSRIFGSGKQEKAIETAYRSHLRETFPEHYTGYDFGPSNVTFNKTQAAIGIGATAAVTGAGLWAAHKQENHRNEWQDTVAGEAVADKSTRVAQAREDRKAHENNASGGITGFINGKPLDVAHWVSRVMIVPPSMHRLMSAAYLSAGLWMGMKGANVLAGRNLAITKASDSFSSLISKEQVWAPLRPLHGLLAYTPNVYTVADRAKQITHHLIPVVTGALGTYLGSTMFFSEKQTRLKNPEFLEDYADRISMEQSKFYAKATAATAIFNTGSGLHLLPFVNYSSNLHNRYLMASGQQVALPGIGGWWSGNPSLYPWGIKKTLHYTVRYLAGDDSEFPKQLPALSHAILAKLYPHLPEQELAQKECALMEAIYKVRDVHLVDHSLPKSKHEIVEAEMTKILTGLGFEQTLRGIGLKPEEANLASNGASGRLAERFGEKNDVARLQAEYKTKAIAHETTGPNPSVMTEGLENERIASVRGPDAHRAA